VALGATHTLCGEQVEIAKLKAALQASEADCSASKKTIAELEAEVERLLNRPSDATEYIARLALAEKENAALRATMQKMYSLVDEVTRAAGGCPCLVNKSFHEEVVGAPQSPLRANVQGIHPATQSALEFLKAHPYAEWAISDGTEYLS